MGWRLFCSGALKDGIYPLKALLFVSTSCSYLSISSFRRLLVRATNNFSMRAAAGNHNNYEYIIILMTAPQLTIAKRAALQAGRILLQHYGRVSKSEVHAKQPNDFVTKADLTAEHSIVEAILKAYPDHAILGEESGASPSDSPYCWVIDPLDGTTNYIHGFPHFAVSIACRKDEQTIVGVVYDPLKNELFEASRGEGAFLNDARIRVSGRQTMSGALLGTGIPYRNAADLDAYFGVLRSLIKGSAGVRRAGAAALDLAYVAAGRFDGFWEFKLRPWDIAAGALIVIESGGKVGDMHGGPGYLEAGHIVAAAPVIYEKMLRRIRDVRAAIDDTPITDPD